MGISRHSRHKYDIREVNTEINTEVKTEVNPDVPRVLFPAFTLYSFDARAPDELSFKERECLGVINNKDPGWWYACDFEKQQSGYVPSNYVQGVYLSCVILCDEEKEKQAHQIQNCLKTAVNSREVCYWKLEKCPSSRPVIVGPFPDDQEDIEIEPNCLKLIRPIGKGTFGGVFYGYCNKNIEVAIMYPDLHSSDPVIFRREVSTLKEIKHPNFVRLFAICSEREPICMVMEYMCHGNLDEHLNSDLGKELKLPSLVNMAAQISDGMKYLESKNLSHKRLCARNIFVEKGEMVKIGPLELQGIYEEERYRIGRYFQIRWTSPEAYTSGEFTIKSDVWSFGVVLYEIFTHGSLPYPGIKTSDEVMELINQNYRMPKPDDPECSDSVYETMLLCWKKNPADRPTFEYLCHFFMDYEETSYKSYYRIPFPARRH